MNKFLNKPASKSLNKPLLALMFAAQLMAGPLLADEVDDEAVKKLVQQEVERLLRTEGALDSAIEAGIKRIILKQRGAARENIEQQQAQAANLRPVDARRDHIFGNPDAAVTLVEYSDFECPFCKRFHPTVLRLMEDNRDKLRWVYRHFPLAFHNPGAQKQAEATECVAELEGNDAFWEYTHAIYRKTKAGGSGFPLADLRPLAVDTGVNGDAFDDCMNSGRTTARVEEDRDDGVKIGVSGTPVSILTNRRGEVRFIVGAVSIEELQSIVDDLLR